LDDVLNHRWIAKNREKRGNVTMIVLSTTRKNNKGQQLSPAGTPVING
jgi:hypothetical protein